MKIGEQPYETFNTRRAAINQLIRMRMRFLRLKSQTHLNTFLRT